MPTDKLRRRGIKLKDFLLDFLSSPHASQVIGTCGQVEPASAAALRMPGLRPNQLVAERALTMGDAASMPNPLSGEGIGPALDSGTIAAKHVRLAFQEGDFSRKRLSAYSVEIQNKYGADYRAASILCTLLARPFISNSAANLARDEPEFARMMAQAVLSQSAQQVLRPSTVLKSSLYWAPRAILRRLGKPERVT